MPSIKLAANRSARLAGKRVLCAAAAIPGHSVPALVLAKAFRDEGAKVCMLSYGPAAAALYAGHGLDCESMPGDCDSAELLYRCGLFLKCFAPSVTLCDWRTEFWLALRRHPPPCTVSVLRCEQFLGYQPLSTELPPKFGHRDARMLAIANAYLSRSQGSPIGDVRELMVADVVAVPGVPALDPPPVDPRYANSRILHTGPLFLDEDSDVAPEVERWLGDMRRAGRPIVVATTGTMPNEAADAQVMACCRDAEWATLLIVADSRSLVALRGLATSRVKLIGPAPLLPLFQRADVVLHHGGHATSLIALLAARPALVLPSTEQDRADTALRLERMGGGVRLRAGTDWHKAISDALQAPDLRVSVRGMAQMVQQQMDTVGPSAVVDAAIGCLHRRGEAS